MNLQFVRYFVTLAEYNNFTKAAEKNFVVQSTFSAGIKKLEQALDCKLFYRDKRNVHLTEEGETLLPKAKELLAMWNNILATTNGQENKKLVVGILNNIHHSASVVPTIKKFKELYSAYHLELIEASQAELIQAVEKKKIDIAFIQNQELDSGVFDKDFVYNETLEVLVSNKHPLYHKTSIKIEELDDVPFIEHTNCILNQEVASTFSDHNLKLNTVFKASHSDMLTALVESNLGVSLMARNDDHGPQVRFVPLSNAMFQRDIYMLWRRDNDSNELQCFLGV